MSFERHYWALHNELKKYPGPKAEMDCDRSQKVALKAKTIELEKV